MNSVKMVILVNMRLKMKCGKIASQCCHASNKAIDAVTINPICCPEGESVCKKKPSKSNISNSSSNQ